ncbi:hypothetical protein K3495_g10832 [Podosphaera aphanis]|nr:hypothetical protein K3495_g10832 [Podosphaera aphanis]
MIEFYSEGTAEIFAFPAVSVELTNEFREQLIREYADDPFWIRIHKQIVNNNSLGPNAAKLPFKLVNNLIYFEDTNSQRLCIPAGESCKAILQMAHDDIGHQGYNAAHERLSKGFYMHNMTKVVREYLKHCPNCKVNHTPRHSPYGSMQPIFVPPQQFHTITIDFILCLPVSTDGNKFDAILSVTDKFSKAVTFIPGGKNWTASQWATALLDRLSLINWGLPRIIISDRDRKFLSQLWRKMFLALGVELLFSTSYHPQTDGSSERTNQTAEIALRYWLMTLKSPGLWPETLARMQLSLNNSTKYSSTQLCPTQVMHGFRAREALDLMTDEHGIPVQLPAAKSKAIAFPVEPTLMTEYRPSHIDAKDAIEFAAMRMKEYYDRKHQPRFFDVGDWVMIRLHHGYTLPALKGLSPKIQRQFVGPFQVAERIGRLAYRLKLPESWKIHDVISIAHLEPQAPPEEDPYKRTHPPGPPVAIAGVEEHEIEKLIAKRKIRKGRGWSIQYLVRWEGYGPESDEWTTIAALKNAKELIRDFERGSD